jgi:hypothetical protein
MAIDILSALEITTNAVKEYVDEQPIVSYGASQYLDALCRETAKNNMGVYVGTDEPIDALDGDIWIDTDQNVGGSINSGLGTNIQLDDTLTVAGMAADAKAVGDVIAKLPIELSDDGYAEVINQRKILNIQSTKTEDKINVVVSLEGGKKVVMDIGYNENNYPVSLTLNGRAVAFNWSGF